METLMEEHNVSTKIEKRGKHALTPNGHMEQCPTIQVFVVTPAP